MARLGDSLDDNVNVGTAANTIDEFEKVRFVVTANIAAGDVDRYLYIAPKACTITGVNEIHITAGSSGEFMLAKDSSTGTIGSSGTDLLSAAIDLTTVAETVQAGSLSAVAGALTLAANDRISLDFATTGHASLAGGLVTIEMYQDA